MPIQSPFGRVAISPAADATNGGQLILGYGGNTDPAIGGASQWRLISNGSTFQLVRVNSGNTGLIAQQVTEDGSYLFQGTSGRFSFDLSSANTIIEYRNPNGGLLVWDWTRDGTTDFDYRWIQDSDFLLTGRVGTSYRSDRPWTFQNTVTVGNAATSGLRDLNFSSTSGNLILRAAHSEPKTYSFADFVGVSSGTLALLEVPQPIVTSSSTAVTLNVAGGFFRLTNATGGANEVTLTVPNNASVPMPIGTVISFVATNGWANLVLGGGVSLTNRTPFPLFFIPRGVTFEIQKISTDGWELTCRAWNPSEVLVVTEELLVSNSGSNFAIENSGGSTTSATGLAANPGAIQLSTGTTATGRSGFMTHNNSFVSASGGGRIYFAADGVALTANANATQDFVARVGFFDGLVSTLPGEGAFFQHSTANSGNWEYVIRDGSVTTSLASSTSATAAANLAVLKKPGAAHTFVINGITQAVGSNQVVSPVRAGGLIVKTAGTTSINLTLRRLLLIQELY